MPLMTNSGNNDQQQNLVKIDTQRMNKQTNQLTNERTNERTGVCTTTSLDCDRITHIYRFINCRR